ncbi:Uncharacterized protein dnl_33550 [Desulfonema limicola]|uniref:Uncharacterized protein n=1 Tax=Desulfonema limicola TaxID=45656 RepID=A0A975B9A7_9BACT|nr:hypothetical protein [Desulfonema limicola]QTA81032.1 Uncharacterized protein dnl_33550 [Desulfonema limicola]
MTEEREHHITDTHPGLLPEHIGCIADTLADPDQIRTSFRFANAKMFTRWFEGLREGKYLVVVVVSDGFPFERHWIITAYIARRLASSGDIEWTKS